MDPARWQHIKAIFEEAAYLDADQRAAFLDEACQGDAALREKVENLLAADAESDHLLEASPLELSDQLFTAETEQHPTRLGPYKIQEFLGRGGMGAVYLAAHQQNPEQPPVALKVLRSGHDNTDLLRRFRVEWNVLSKLDHPNIAELYGQVEMAGHRPFFAMEYIEGLPITAYCDTHKLPVAKRLQLFAQICSATHHAHQNQVIHRDIKPANVFVTNDGNPKLLDFGIAKVMNPDMLDTSALLTRTGVRVLTPAYASPEQLRSEAISPASDIYSLGALLYEVLTGFRPHDTEGLSQKEIEERVSQEMPTTPSERVQEAASSQEEHTQDTLSGITIARGTTGQLLSRQLKGDLDTIILKALHKDPERRYADAAAFEDDIQRYLTGRPVLARPDSMGYRMQRWAKRHQVPLSLAAGVAGLLVIILSFALPSKHINQASDASSAESPLSLVTLPFKHQGGNDYFATGVVETLNARLSAVPDLLVISNSSALHYQNSDKTPQQIGQELGVEYILTGTIQYENPTDPSGRIRVVPQLIRSSDNATMWADTYNENLSDIFEVQESIAEKITEELNLTLLQHARSDSSELLTHDLNAYNYYLRGLEFARNDEDEPSLRLGEAMLTEAIEIDSTFSGAYAELSMVYSAMFFHQIEATEERCLASEQAAQKALIYGSSNPRSHIALGMHAYRCKLHLTQAVSYLKKALELDANATDAMWGLALVLRRQGKIHEAISYFEQQALHDPHGADYQAIEFTNMLLRRYPESQAAHELALETFPEGAKLTATYSRMILSWTGSASAARDAFEEGQGGTIDDDYTHAVSIYIDLVGKEYQRALDRISALRKDILDTQAYFIPVSHLRARIYRELGNDEEALRQEELARQTLELHLQSHPDDPRAHATLGRVSAGLGYKEDALYHGRFATELMPIQRDAVRGPLRLEDLAATYTLAGEYDAAIAALDTLLAHPGFVSKKLIASDPTWDPLRTHPKYAALIDS